jgi:calcineurin-like phosphoesterase family protein
MPDGVTPLRPFANAEEMNEQMIENWNSVVKHDDKVYHLGDVVINKKFLPILHRLNGQKRLILGNHDHWKTNILEEYFVAVYGSRSLHDMILTHIPVHPNQIDRFGTNVHGHLHGTVMDDPRYLNVSVEQIGFTPIDLEEVRARIKAKQDRYDYSTDKVAWGNGSGPKEKAKA